MKRKPCESCEACAADCGQCQMYYEWLCETWLRYQQYVPRDYWNHRKSPKEKRKYVHPDVLRRYLKDGPCKRCPCNGSCDIPCAQYLCWWDARMVWLKWKIQHKTPPMREGFILGIMIQILPALQ